MFFMISLWSTIIVVFMWIAWSKTMPWITVKLCAAKISDFNFCSIVAVRNRENCAEKYQWMLYNEVYGDIYHQFLQACKFPSTYNNVFTWWILHDVMLKNCYKYNRHGYWGFIGFTVLSFFARMLITGHTHFTDLL